MFLSPGIKLGYVFGDQGGFVIGLEVSAFAFFQWGGTSTVGGVMSVDVTTNGDTRLHAGAQGSLELAGLDVGPTLYIPRGAPVRIGVSLTPWAGFVFGFPYYSYSAYLGGLQQHEVGGFGKYPLCMTCRSAANPFEAFSFGPFF